MKNARGFTLLEIMIVLGILAAIVALGLPRMNFKTANVKTVSRQLGLVSREARNQARVKGRTYRIVFNMPAGNSQHKYWIESADASFKAPSAETEERQKAAAKSGDAKKAGGFQKDEGLLKGEKELPPDLYFSGIETSRNEDLITGGETAIYISSDGLVEKSAIQISNRKQPVTWTLILNPLTGHADIVEKAVRLKDANRE